ncbi:hypothetical protein Acsp04_65430 [Actinomadura sp. NBRC 104425]|uniref:FAD-dependent monooxygenase n=1 Tax=Actinomadura sp. NBRC 104425 TaxID=3032204 RepID=UPI0024A2CCD1|nr:hypothetical protein Acsp04_65430 [Actinomadura sp. NBRC 104425]
MTYDVLIVGGGPAGLAGAVVLGRALRSVIVIDDNTPRNVKAAEVHNFLTREGTSPAEFLAAGRVRRVRRSAHARASRSVVGSVSAV